LSSNTRANTNTDTKIEIHGKKPSEKLISLIHDLVDTGLKLTSQFDLVWEQGTKEGFSREEIGEIVRPIARQKGLNKDQVYYLTHKPDMLEKAKRQYQNSKDN
jgi:hypothetical protein